MEKDIDLRKTKNYVINVDSSKESMSQCKEVLDSLGIPFERHSANTTPSPPNPYGKHIVGCALSHLELLRSMDPGTLVLEDDIIPTGNISLTFSVPSNTDAVYLGVSNHGTIRNNKFGYPGIVMASQETENFKRVYNMCGTHAMLFLSERYIRKASEVAESFIKNIIPVDVALASIHKDFNILTPNSPFFYQKDQPDLTNFELKI